MGEKIKRKTSLADFLIVILFVYFLSFLFIFFNISPTMESGPRLAEDSRAYTQIAERCLSHQVSTSVNLLVHFFDSHTTTPPLSPASQSKSLVFWKRAHLMEAVDKVYNNQLFVVGWHSMTLMFPLISLRWQHDILNLQINLQIFYWLLWAIFPSNRSLLQRGFSAVSKCVSISPITSNLQG